MLPLEKLGSDLIPQLSLAFSLIADNSLIVLFVYCPEHISSKKTSQILISLTNDTFPLSEESAHPNTSGFISSAKNKSQNHRFFLYVMHTFLTSSVLKYYTAMLPM